MPTTKINDAIIPEIFAPYFVNRTKELSKVVSSGIAAANGVLDELVTKGGKLVNMPFWKELGGEDEVLTDGAALTPGKVTAGSDVAALLARGKSWGANELAGALAGDSPMKAISEQVAGWWARMEQKVLISALKGIFSGALKTSHVNDVTGMTGASASIGAAQVLDTKQLLGDAADGLAVIAMHSAAYTKLQKQNLITYIPDSRGEVVIPTYLSYEIVVDDSCPKAGDVYDTYIFGRGSFGRGEGSPVDLTSVETARDALAGEDYLITRRAFVLHPFGVKFTNANVTGVTPDNTELADAANWEKVYPDKHIALALLRHKIA